MIRKIIKIDENRCNGCGACAAACHEGAIEMIDGKAVLTREDYCDGLGDCLPECPTGAISFEEREAPAYDEVAVHAAKQKKMKEQGIKMPHAGCPGAQVRQMVTPKTENTPSNTPAVVSQLCQWPCQIVNCNLFLYKSSKVKMHISCIVIFVSRRPFGHL